MILMWLDINFRLHLQDIPKDRQAAQIALSLTLAFFLDVMWADRPSKKMQASPWFETASKLACDMMTAQLQSAPQACCLSAGVLLHFATIPAFMHCNEAIQD